MTGAGNTFVSHVLVTAIVPAHRRSGQHPNPELSARPTDRSPPYQTVRFEEYPQSVRGVPRRRLRVSRWGSATLDGAGSPVGGTSDVRERPDPGPLPSLSRPGGFAGGALVTSATCR